MHAALQLENGDWTSKMGSAEDILHILAEVLEGPEYGHVARFLSRPRPTDSGVEATISTFHHS